jgi:hypothetical protein
MTGRVASRSNLKRKLLREEDLSHWRHTGAGFWASLDRRNRVAAVQRDVLEKALVAEPAIGGRFKFGNGGVVPGVGKGGGAVEVGAIGREMAAPVQLGRKDGTAQ